jgi:hypothetical protein
MGRRIAGSRWNDLAKTREASVVYFLFFGACFVDNTCVYCCVLIGSGCRRSICAILNTSCEVSVCRFRNLVRAISLDQTCRTVLHHMEFTLCSKSLCMTTVTVPYSALRASKVPV